MASKNRPSEADVATAEAVVNAAGSIATLQAENNAEVAQKEKTRMSLAAAYKNENKATVTGSPMYRPYFGNSMPISINGVFIAVPLDGRPYAIPESFAEVFNTRIRSVDDDLTLQKKLGDVGNNHETFAGELDLIQKA